MSINGYHASHCYTEPYYFGNKRKVHSAPLSEAGTLELLGIEYELSFNGYVERETISDRLQAVMGKTETDGGRLKCERDGSLNNGFECISYPATFGCHMGSYGWDKFFEALGEYPTNGTEDGNNGMHIHISRASLGNTVKAQEKCIAKLIYMLDKYTTMFGKIAGRSYARSHWASAYNAGILETDPAALAVYKAKQAYENADRYRALNLRNSATVELRIFAVDNRLDHFRARVQFAHWLVAYCKSTTFDAIFDTTPASIKATIRALDETTYGDLIALVNEIYGA